MILFFSLNVQFLDVMSYMFFSFTWYKHLAIPYFSSCSMIYGDSYLSVLLSFLSFTHISYVNCVHYEIEKKLGRLLYNKHCFAFVILQVVRTSLMSCLLKTLKHNIDSTRPIKVCLETSHKFTYLVVYCCIEMLSGGVLCAFTFGY
jgi:hypothetical protein